MSELEKLQAENAQLRLQLEAFARFGLPPEPEFFGQWRFDPIAEGERLATIYANASRYWHIWRNEEQRQRQFAAIARQFLAPYLRQMEGHAPFDGETTGCIDNVSGCIRVRYELDLLRQKCRMIATGLDVRGRPVSAEDRASILKEWSAP